VAGTLIAPAAAQEASPAASPTGEVTKSITREEYFTQLAEAYPMEEAAQTGGELIYVQTNDIQTLNPTLVQDTYSSYITGAIFNALITASAIDGTYVPDLADYWELAADGITYTFYLNPNVTWQDGTPLTSADVAFSFDSIVDETSISVRQSDVTSVVKSYRAIDDHTFEITAVAPVANFLDKGPNNVAIVPKHIWESVPFADWGADPGSTGQDPTRVVGTGPFTFVEWVASDHVTIARNANYWDSGRTPVIDSFTYRIIPEPSSAVQAFVTGEVDFAGIPLAQVDSLKESNPENTYAVYDTTSFTYYSPNLDPAKTTLFEDRGVRQALMYALDRQLAAEQVLFGYGIQADGTQPVLSVAYAPDQVTTIYNYDPDKARSLLEAAGWVDSDGDGIREKDGVKFSFEMQYAEGVQTYVQLIPYMQQAWSEIGIEVTPTAVPFPTLVENFTSGNFELVTIGFSWTIDGDQGSMFRSDSFAPNGFNCGHYQNPEYDKLNDEQALELDPDKRRQLLIEQSNIINDEQPVGILFFSKAVTGIQPRVHNLNPNGYSLTWALQWVWLEA
jgi:peptide/nickel transport system substrate-binding protein